MEALRTRVGLRRSCFDKHVVAGRMRLMRTFGRALEYGAGMRSRESVGRRVQAMLRTLVLSPQTFQTEMHL